MFMTMGGLFSQVDAKPDKVMLQSKFSIFLLSFYLAPSYMQILVQEDMVVFVGNVHFTVRKTQEQSSLAMTQVCLACLYAVRATLLSCA